MIQKWQILANNKTFYSEVDVAVPVFRSIAPPCDQIEAVKIASKPSVFFHSRKVGLFV